MKAKIEHGVGSRKGRKEAMAPAFNPAHPLILTILIQTHESKECNEICSRKGRKEAMAPAFNPTHL